MFTFVTAFDWCSGGYDLFNGPQNGCSCHRAETLDSNIADTASGPAQVCQLQRQGLAIQKPRVRRKVTAGQITWIHTRIFLGGGVRIWISIIIPPSVKEDTW